MKGGRKRVVSGAGRKAMYQIDAARKAKAAKAAVKPSAKKKSPAKKKTKKA